ncbi:MAG: hypothetical protein HC769_32825 [Cyanobacteria bacterium CRU_2_1]|nr:hypothetical protein [Cyanobacteria bacterium CRU_2_1]
MVNLLTTQVICETTTLLGRSLLTSLYISGADQRQKAPNATPQINQEFEIWLEARSQLS